MTLLKYSTPLDLFFTSFEDDFFGTRILPATDISENEKQYEISLSLPGFEKTDLKLDVENDVLTISGQRKKGDKKFTRSESYYGTFTRKFTIPKDAAVDKIEAEHKNGILQIIIPKSTETIKTKRIEVK